MKQFKFLGPTLLLLFAFAVLAISLLVANRRQAAGINQLELSPESVQNQEE